MASNFICCLCKKMDLEHSEIRKLSCGHGICLMCLNKHCIDKLNGLVRNKTKGIISCPMNGCNMDLPVHVIYEVLDNKSIEQLDNELINRLDLKMVKCSFCGSKFETDDLEISFQCQFCGFQNCYQCKMPHSKMSCKTFQKKSASEKKKIEENEKSEADKQRSIKLVEIAETSLKFIETKLIFVCEGCELQCNVGLKFKNCSHTMCKECMVSYITDPATNLPIVCYACNERLLDVEIVHFLNEEQIEKFLSNSLSKAVNMIDNNYHCKTPNCTYICYFKDNEKGNFKCPNCKIKNCIKCRTIHNGIETCKSYQEKLKKIMIDTSDLMECPKCKHYIKKASGCNWIQCSKCKLELCWILKMPRWGPKGPGDNSGGCKCMVDGKFCHPDCKGCIPDNESMEYLPPNILLALLLAHLIN